MTKRKFLCTGNRYWHFTRPKWKNEFDISYCKNVTGLRLTKEKEYDYILTHENYHLLRSTSLIRKISEVSGLPENVVNCVLLDFVDLLLLALSKNKTVSYQSLGSFKNDNGKVSYIPSKQLLEELNLMITNNSSVF